MTEIMKLAQEYAMRYRINRAVDEARAALQSAIEAMQAKLDAMEVQTPVVYRKWSSKWHEWEYDPLCTPDSEPLYAAPKAMTPEPLTDEQIEHLVDISYKHWQNKTTFDIAAVRADFRDHGIGGTP